MSEEGSDLEHMGTVFCVIDFGPQKFIHCFRGWRKLLRTMILGLYFAQCYRLVIDLNSWKIISAPQSQTLTYGATDEIRCYAYLFNKLLLLQLNN